MRRGYPASEHPAAQILSLFSTGDLPWSTRARLQGHIRRCAECGEQVNLFRAAKLELRREANAQALTGFEAIVDWNRLEREMLGNIAVGVAAARCIDKVKRGRIYIRRGAFATGILALLLAGWMTHIPKEQTDHLVTSLRRAFRLRQQETIGTVVRSTPEGIAVRSQGTTLTILHPASAVVTLSGSSGVAARYVDEETGQVTIANVYGQ